MLHNNENELRLAFEDTDSGCVVRVQYPSTGELYAHFVLPFTEKELSGFWQRFVGQKWQDTLAADVNLDLIARQIGERLFDALFTGEILSCLRTCQAKANAQGTFLCINLDLGEAPNMRRMPWEFLYDPDLGEFLTLSSHASFARYTGLMHQLLPVKMQKPLRALVVIPRPSGYPPVAADREWIGFVDTVDYLATDGKLIVERLQKPTLLNLQRRLREGEFHILHFVGHSSFDPDSGDGRLVIEDEMGRGRLVAGQHLATLMQDHYSLRLLWLSDPDGTQHAPGAHPLMSVAQYLVRRGVGAVVAPQFSIPRAHWLTFARTFYACTSALMPVDGAVRAARRILRSDYGDLAWAAPVLYSRVLDGHLFDDGTNIQRVLPAAVTDSIASRLNSLRIRTATRETMARWGADFSDSPTNRGT